jgi:hypothetical protein
MTVRLMDLLVMSRRLWLCSLILLLMLAFGCLMLASSVYSWLTRPRLSYRDSALQQVDEILRTVIEHPGGDLPSDGQRYLMAHACWSLIQPTLARNHNTYTLIIMRYDDSRDQPYPVHDTIEIIVHAVFPDQTRLEFIYFQGGVSQCRAVAEPH